MAWHVIAAHTSHFYVNSRSQNLDWLVGLMTTFVWNNGNSSCVCWHFTFRLFSSCLWPNTAIWWQWLPCKEPTSTDQGSQTSDLKITRRWLHPWAAAAPNAVETALFALWCFYFYQHSFSSVYGTSSPENSQTVRMSCKSLRWICALH